MQQLNEDNGSRSSPYTDFFDGEAYLNAIRAGDIKRDDTVIMLSLDGAQLYRNKVSECWFYIWIILDLAPELRYKKCHVIPGKNVIVIVSRLFNMSLRWNHSWPWETKNS